MSIHVKNISKHFGDFHALDNVSLEIKSGELVALLGPSGSGKTTLLRIIAGLESADAGEVLLEGKDTGHKKARDRNVGFVFQHYALFKHMTVFENVAFGIRVRPRGERPSETQIRRKALTLLKLVHLEGLHSRYPGQLSGGQRQRVALARALAVEPRVLLLDEPFGALDAKVRKELRRWMRRLHEELHITSIFVTHDQEEAMEMADRVVVMSNGRIEQMGAPDEVWNKPRNSFVYDFLGNYNAFDGWKDAKGGVHLTEYDAVPVKMPEKKDAPQEGFLRRYPLAHSLLSKFIPLAAVEEDTPGKPFLQRELGESGTAVKLFARPHEMVVTKTPDSEEYISAEVIHINPAGPLVKLELERPNGEILQAEIPADEMKALRLTKGNHVYVRPKQFKVFD